MLMPAEADACTCLPAGAPCQAYWDVDAVFVGRVESIEPLAGRSLFRRRVVTFTVVEPLKGAVTGTRVALRTGYGRGDCGYPFRKGLEYVVYAASGGNGELETSICSRTRPVGRADADLEYARGVRSGFTSQGRIAGMLRLVRDSLRSARAGTPKPLGGIPVLLERDGRAYRTVTANDGTFAFEGLDAGTYTARLELPAQYYADAFPRSVVLRDARSCAEVDAVAHYDGRVAGRVVNGRGRAIAGLTLDLTLREGIDEPFGPRRLRAVTRGDGTYEFPRVPPGSFVVGINTQARADGGFTEPRVLHPGTERLADATTVMVGGGDRVRLTDFKLPGDVVYVQIDGVVLDPDGVPVEGARVYMKGPADGDHILTEPSITDGSGRFVIAALDGRDYQLFAERPRRADGARVDSSLPVAVVAAESLPPVVLRLLRTY